MGNSREWRVAKRATGLCLTCGIRPAAPHTRCDQCRDRRKVQTKQAHRKVPKSKGVLIQELKLKVLIRLGGTCSCCGESNAKFLTLDHEHNNGRKERMPSRRVSMLRAILRGERPDMRLLCWNCNCGRVQNGGICPHKEIYKQNDTPKDTHLVVGLV